MPVSLKVGRPRFSCRTGLNATIFNVIFYTKTCCHLLVLQDYRSQSGWTTRSKTNEKQVQRSILQYNESQGDLKRVTNPIFNIRYTAQPQDFQSRKRSTIFLWSKSTIFTLALAARLTNKILVPRSISSNHAWCQRVTTQAVTMEASWQQLKKVLHLSSVEWLL